MVTFNRSQTAGQRKDFGVCAIIMAPFPATDGCNTGIAAKLSSAWACNCRSFENVLGQRKCYRLHNPLEARPLAAELRLEATT